MLGRRLALLVGVLLCVAGGGLVLGGASALAFNVHFFSGSFGGEGTGNGQFVEPSGVAVNASTGDVYVVDRGNGRVEQFSSAGVYVSQFDGSAAPTGAFSSPSAIAVDNSGNALDPSVGDVYVVDTGHNAIDKFSSAGTYLGQLTETTGGASFGELDGVAVDAAGVVWVYQGSGEIDSFSDALGNEYLSQRFTPFVARPGFAVDGEDNLYVRREAPFFGKLNSAGEALSSEVDSEASTAAAVDLSSNEVFIDEMHTVGVFSAGGSFLERFGVEQGVEHLQSGSGIAVTPGGGTVYVADATADVVDVFTAVVVPDVVTGSASGVQPTSATVGGTVNPDGVQLTECRFEYGASTAYGQSVPCVPAAGSIPADSSEHVVSADITGLTAGSAYHFRLRAGNVGGANFGEDATFETPPPPTIENAAASNLTGSSVDLSARVDPKGAQTVYRFEYGPTAAYGTSVPVPDGTIAATEGAQTVSVHVTGLQQGTTYHWRVVAQNASGNTTGEDHTFIYDVGGGGLPDNRAYEMVTPPQKNGALIGSSFSGKGIDISEDGSRVFITTIACFADTAACNANRGAQGTPVAFTRTSGGWVASGLVPPASRFSISMALGYNATVGTALFAVPTPSGAEALLAREPDGSFVNVGLATSPSLGAGPDGKGNPFATADLSHLIYTLGPGAHWPFDPAETGNSLYEYVGVGNSAPTLVGVSGGAGSTDLISKCGTEWGALGGKSALNFQSADGSVVFFAAQSCPSGSGVNAGVPVPADMLYARIGGARTVLISGRSPSGCRSAACLGSSPRDARFAGASTDGSRVFFTSAQQLTDQASEGSLGSENLYEYDFSRPAGENLVALSAGDTSGQGPGVTGVEAVSSDGSHVYFAATGVLTGVANSQGQLPRAGEENLYVYERDGEHPLGRVAFIATLPSSDSEFAVHRILSGYGLAPGFLGGVGGANVTPDGRFLVFMSHGRLTRDDTSTNGATQVFRYDAQTGVLVRVSVGERGFNDDGNSGRGSASIVAAGVAAERFGGGRPDPTMSHDGSYVFFESPVGLTPRALNDVPVATNVQGHPEYAENVYEWHEGHVRLISDGRDVSAWATLGAGTSATTGTSVVELVGSDATGANVFFTTSDRLTGQDTDTQLDYYDARICTSNDPCVAPPPAAVAPCGGEGCRSTPVAPPSLGEPVSASFAGAGNLVANTKPAVKTRKKAKPKKAAKRKKRNARRRTTGRHGKAKKGSVRSTKGRQVK